MTIKNQFSPPKLRNRLGILALFCVDFAALILLFHFSVIIRQLALPLVFELPGFSYAFADYWWIFPLWLAVMIYEEGYSRRMASWDEVKFIWKSAFFSSLAILTMLFLMKRGQEYSRILVATMFVMAGLFFPVLRLNAKKLLYYFGLMRRKVLIIGSGQAAVSAYNAIIGEPNLGYQVAGFIDDIPGKFSVCGCRVRPGINRIERYIKAAGIHDVVIAKPDLDKSATATLINNVQHKAENTLFIPDIKGIAVAGTRLRHFFKQQAIIIEMRNNLTDPLRYGTKRLLDYLAGVVVFALCLPPMLVIAAIVRLDSKGPALLRQPRLGKNAREFICFKFRTMFPDAEERLQNILDSDTAAKDEWEKHWKLAEDPRITRVGRFLRKTSLDELPQILNVIRGEMSIVGPRPYLPREWKHIEKESGIIHSLPPGITGLWQVSGRSNQDYFFRITMDSWYVKNWDLWLDVMILFKTLGVVLRREGAM